MFECSFIEEKLGSYILNSYVAWDTFWGQRPITDIVKKIVLLRKLRSEAEGQIRVDLRRPLAQICCWGAGPYIHSCCEVDTQNIQGQISESSPLLYVSSLTVFTDSSQLFTPCSLILLREQTAYTEYKLSPDSRYVRLSIVQACMIGEILHQEDTRIWSCLLLLSMARCAPRLLWQSDQFRTVFRHGL